MIAVTKRLLAAVSAILLLAACGTEEQGSNADPDQVDAVAAPDSDVCRELTPEDVTRPSNATRTVACSEPHTAQTYLVENFPSRFEDTAYDDEELASYAYATCRDGFQKFVGGDESLALRTIVSWAWFRPSETAWSEGARWFRCDVIGGGDESESYAQLPTDARGLLHGKVDDKWLVCAEGARVSTAPKVPCSQGHNWRAVSTIKLGEPEDDYPGDRVVRSRTRDFCDNSVAAVLGYPVEYDFAYTWFHAAEWAGGNRRSVCWARTDQ